MLKIKLREEEFVWKNKNSRLSAEIREEMLKFKKS